MIVCVVNKGIVSIVTLNILMNYTFDDDELFLLFGLINWSFKLIVRLQRILTMKQIPQEKLKGSIKAPEGWPETGKIKFTDVYMQYRPNTDVVLKGLSFEVASGDKIGIVGRTGAGKSTLSMVVTRIVEVMKGTIEIDGVDISKLDMADLRD